MSERCEHFGEIRDIDARTSSCEACAAIGAEWNELRVCLTCGHVGCCEDSEHAHALRHFNSTGHPIISPLARREPWGWCYIPRRHYDPMPANRFTRRSALATLLGRFGRG